MVIRGHIENGEIVLDEAVALPEGAAVTVEVSEDSLHPGKRVGGIWRGRVRFADDFDQLPDEISSAFGMTQ